MIRKEDLNELKRIATNTYDEDKKFVNRIIMEVGSMEREIKRLQDEVARLKLEKGA